MNSLFIDTSMTNVSISIVKDNKIVSSAFNKKESKKCALYHAEILAIKKASKKLKDRIEQV